MANKYQTLDLSHLRNVYAVGDIHGHFSLLEAKLESLGFDPEQDALISVGDLVDRGPESERALEFCRKPWFHWIRGNHEDLLRIFVHQTQQYSEEQMARNGGGWLLKVPEEDRYEFAQVLNDAPLILDVIAPSGKLCGFVHACFPSDDWRHAAEIAENHENICMWDRTDVHSPKPQGIRYIDYVFHGHTPLQGPRKVGNVVWIDTGVYRDGGKLTIVKLP